jgi:DNA-binding transcriptional MerR regulator
MSWSIAEVARMSGVTARTLRHYDAVGLLRPSRVDPGGRRYYGQRELLRLQRILLLRELGLGLAAIAEALAADAADAGAEGAAEGADRAERADEANVAGTRDAAGTIEALRRHEAWLEGERERLATLLATVRKTIDSMQKGTVMTAEEMFEGFENPYEHEARQRWGDEAVDAANARLPSLSPKDADRLRHGFTRVHEALVPLHTAGVPVDDGRVQAIIAEHYGVVSLTWTPDAAAYRGLGAMYTDDERFRRNIGGGDDDLVRYLRAGMEVYADSVLS